MQNKVTLIFHNGHELLQNSHQNITGAVQESDGNSCAMAAAKLFISRFGSVDITKTSLNSQNFNQIVNWEVYQQVEDSFRNVKELELQKNPYFYVWTHFFTAAPIWEIEEHTYYIVELTDKDLNFFPQFNRRNLNKNNLIERVILEKQHLKIKKTVIFLNVKDFDHGRYHAPKMYIDTVGLFNGIYRRKQERWLTYNVTQGSYPDDEILQQTTSIIIPGSTSSAYDDKPWIRQLENFILKIYDEFTHIKIMGICFGFQLLAKAFGGSVTPCVNRIKHKGFYYYGNETVQLSNDLFEINCFKDLTQIDSIIINKAHGDVVPNLPDMLISYGSSKTAQNEIFMSRDNRIFGMQSHPEYSSQQILMFISALKASEEKKQFKDFYYNENYKYFVKERGDTLG